MLHRAFWFIIQVYNDIAGEISMTNDSKKRFDDSAETVRLNVFLQESGVASRRKADELISAGMVKVNGKAVTQLGARISRSDKVHVHGKLLAGKNIPKVVYLLNKPDMCLTTRFDAKGRRTIFDLPAVKNLPPNVQAVGRLDYRSEGLLLLTNDGDLAYALTHPRFSVEKAYAVLVADGVTIEDVEKLRAGVMLDDGMAKAVSVRLGNKERMGASRGQWLELVVTEGRNRLIRRMAETIGLKVVRLVRVGMGDVLLPATLKPGQAIVVDSNSRQQLEQIKNEMLRSSEPGDKAAAKSARLEDSVLAKRKLRRQVKLNDEEYAMEASRRSAEASAQRKQRSQRIREEEAAQNQRDEKPRAVRRPDRGAERTAQRSEVDGPRPVQRTAGEGPRPVRRESSGGPRPVRRENADAPRPVRREAADAPRPVRRDAADTPRPARRGAADAPRPVRREAADTPRPARSGATDAPRPVRRADSDRRGMKAGTRPASHSKGKAKSEDRNSSASNKKSKGSPRKGKR
jgi:pseudouridine synthase